MPRTPLTPGGRGVIVDPPDGKLPLQTWARAEGENRKLPERGYDDPTAHCFVAGVPRSMYVPSPFHIVQTAGHVVFLFERMAWRIVPTDGRAHLPDQRPPLAGRFGRPMGRRYARGRHHQPERQDLAERSRRDRQPRRTVVERFTPVDADTIAYEATVTDPIVYTRPWTIALPIKRQNGELLEVACHEDDQDLPRLKAIKDAARAGKK